MRDAKYEWMKYAACRGRDPEAWFPESGVPRSLNPQRVCASCPVQAECLLHAHDVGATHGIWGGLRIDSTKWQGW